MSTDLHQGVLCEPLAGHDTGSIKASPVPLEFGMVAEQSKLQGPSMSSSPPTRKINNVYLRIDVYQVMQQPVDLNVSSSELYQGPRGSLCGEDQGEPGEQEDLSQQEGADLQLRLTSITTRSSKSEDKNERW